LVGQLHHFPGTICKTFVHSTPSSSHLSDKDNTS
jgi:hypothetical protein